MDFENNNDIKEEIECRNCGGAIPKENMDFENDVATCPFCGTSHRIHDSITKHYTNTYISTNRTEIPKKDEYLLSSKKSSKFVIVFFLLIFGIMIIGEISINQIFNRMMDEYEKSTKYTVTTETTTTSSSITEIDPFDSTNGDYINVDFIGFNGQGSALVHIPDKWSELHFTLSQATNLSNGDEVTITLSNTEAYPEYNFTRTTGRATVNGLVYMME